MGWTSYHVNPEYKNGKLMVSNASRKAECLKELNWSGNTAYGCVTYKVIKSVMIGSVCYAAVEHIIYNENTNEQNRTVFACVCLTRVKNNSFYNFFYKIMDETEGPCEAKCPESILKLLSEPANEYAADWRERCHAYNSRKKNK